MLKSTTPAKASSNTCLKNANINVTQVKTTTACTKNVATSNTVMVPASKSTTLTKTMPTCSKSTTSTCKNINCTKSAINGETTASTFSIPVVPKSQPAKAPVSSCPKIVTSQRDQTANFAAVAAANAVTSANTVAAATTNGNSIPTPPPKVENTELRIIIIDENWSQYCYRIKINTPFGKLINRFCQQVRKIDHKSVLFWYHGRLVEDEDTPKTLNIKDGEVILAHYIKST